MNRVTCCLTLVLLIACGSDPAQEDAGLQNLTRIEGLQAAFDRDTGVPRMVLLLSPT
jgi:hypothetical protein